MTGDSPHALKILFPGSQTTVQDLERKGYQWSGTPICGALDQYALRLGNILLGQDDDLAGLEATFIGPTIEALIPL